MTKIIPTSRLKWRSISFAIPKWVLFCMLLMFVVGCKTKQQSVIYNGQDMRQLVRAASKLGFDIEEDDDWKLMIEASKWLGTPYAFGGNTKSGVDCSGLSKALYRDVCGLTLHRRSIEQYNKDCKPVSQKRLKEGDLVFFAPSGKKNDINHVGVYLKNGKFVHASKSKGVVVSRLTDNYYQKTWADGGRVKSK